MSLLKTDVTWFLSRCKEKAFQSIIDKMVIELKEKMGVPTTEFMLGSTPNYATFKSKFRLLSTNLNLTQQFLGLKNTSPFTDEDAFEYLTKSTWNYGFVCEHLSDPAIAYLSVFLNRLPREDNFRYYVKYVLHTGTDVELCRRISDMVEEYVAVSDEYKKIQDKMGELRANQCVKLLESLGFDVSILREQKKKEGESVKKSLKIDTSLIFVCGDNNK